MRIFLYSLLILICFKTINAQENQVWEKVFSGVEQVISLYQTVSNPELLQEIESLNQDKGISIYTRCYLDDTTVFASILNLISDARYEVLEPPFLCIDLHFSPSGEMGYFVEIDFQLSPDLTSFSALLQPLEQEINQILEGAFNPDENQNLVQALINFLRNLFGNPPPDVYTPFTVHFVPDAQQIYGFDSLEFDCMASKYLSVRVNKKTYYLPWKSVGAGQTDKVGVRLSINNDTTFSQVYTFDSLRFESFPEQVPIVTLEGSEGKFLNIMVGDNGDNRNIAASYTDYSNPENITTPLAGKLAVATYETESFEVVLVSVNGSQLPEMYEAQQSLNNIYSQAVVEFSLSLTNDFTCDYDLNSNAEFDNTDTDNHLNYTPEMDAMIDCMKSRPDYNPQAYYMFFVDNPVNSSMDGYMPFKKHFGFIFSYTPRTLAHELGHGVFRLRHVFSQYPSLTQGSTSNLMDYNNGNKLWKYQWDYVHNPQWVVNWLEGEGEGWSYADKAKQVSLEGLDRAVLSPCGVPINITNIKTGTFNVHGSLSWFTTTDGLEYGAVYRKTDEFFLGYANEQYFSEIQAGGLHQDLIFSSFTYANIGDTVIAYAKEFYDDRYLSCVCKFEWENELPADNDISGSLVHHPIPQGTEISLCEGSHCVDIPEGMQGGVGLDYYLGLYQQAMELGKLEDIRLLADYLNETTNGKSFAFYGYGLELTGVRTIQKLTTEEIVFFRTREVYSLSDFYELFPEENITDSRGCDVIFSEVDIWAGINRQTYNTQTIDYVKLAASGVQQPYTYSYGDLKVRRKIAQNGGIVFDYMQSEEQEGKAHPVSASEGYSQYFAKFGTSSAIFAWMEFFFEEMPIIEVEVRSLRLIRTLLKNDNIYGAAERQILREMSCNRDVFANLIRNVGKTIAKKIGAVADIFTHQMIKLGKVTKKSLSGNSIVIKIKNFSNELYTDIIKINPDNTLEILSIIDDANPEVIGRIDNLGFKIKGTNFESVEILQGLDGRVGVRVFRSFTNAQIEEYVAQATQQGNQGKVMLGKYDNGGPTSYIARAGNDHTYFDMGNEMWIEAESIVNGNVDEMWKINKGFIEDQKDLGKEFYLSHDPDLATGFFLKEIGFLIDELDGTITKIDEQTWKVIW